MSLSSRGDMDEGGRRLTHEHVEEGEIHFDVR